MSVEGRQRRTPRAPSPQPTRHLRRRDDHELGRRPGQPDVEQLVQPLAGGGQLHQNHDLALHALEAADRLEQDLVGFVGDVLGREAARRAVVVEGGVLQAGVAETPVAPDLACVGPGSREHGDAERRDAFFLDEPVEGLAQRLKGGGTGFGADDCVPPFGLADNDRLLAAAVEAGGEIGDRAGISVVLEQLVALEAEAGDDVGPDEGLAGVVEDPEDVVGVDQQARQKFAWLTTLLLQVG